MRHDPASAAVVVMLRSLKMHGMAQAVSELLEQGAPAFDTAVPILSQLLKAELAEREVRSIAYQLKAARFPAFKDLSGFDFASSEVNEAMVQQLYRGTFIEGADNVVLIGATNRPNLIDPALLRPGRFDELIYVGTPDTAGRRRILAIHTKDMPLAKDVDLESLARRTERFTGADLEDLVRRAGLTALRRGLDSAQVTMEDFEKALTETRASVTEDMLSDYAKIQETLKSDAVRPTGGIGFVLPGMLRPRGPGKGGPGSGEPPAAP